MDFKKLYNELKKGELEFVLTKGRNRLFYQYLPPLQASVKLPTVFVASSTRSGSTWLFELLLKSKKYRAIFEPIPIASTCMDILGQSRPILSRDTQVNSGNSFLTELTTYDRSNWRSQHSNSRNIYFLTHGELVKSTRANFCLDFIESNFVGNRPKIVYLVRNPFDVVRSRIKAKSTSGGRLIEEFSSNPLEFMDAQDPFFSAYFDQYRDLAQSLTTEVQLEAFSWCLENKWVLDVWKERGWHLVVFENLYVDFEREYSSLCDFIGISYPKKILKSKDVKSSTAFSGVDTEFIDSAEYQNVPSFLNRWKTYFSEQQLAEINSILQHFNIDYNSLLDDESRSLVGYDL